MTSRNVIRLAVTAALAALGAAGGCSRDADTLGPASYPTDSEIFLDGFGPDLGYQAFGGSKVDALDIDRKETYAGTAALRVTVPSAGDPSGSFAGGAFVTNTPRDLTRYDALTFWARASMPATLNLAALGNDNTGTSRYTASRTGLPLTTSWTRYVIPIPLAEKLIQERGMFSFAEGHENGIGYDIWFDEVQFERLGTIANPRPSFTSETTTAEVGGTLTVKGSAVTFDVAGVDQTVEMSPNYFTFASSDEAVVAVGEDGSLNVVGAGSATITAKLGAVDAAGSLAVTTFAPPTSAAPTPTVPDTAVISLFSNAYTNRTVDTWSAPWDLADVADVQIAGDDTKRYSNLVYAGILTESQPIDASVMTFIHVDVWTPDATAFKLKLVDFGANGVYDGGGDDSQHEVTVSAPTLTAGAWSSLDIPLSRFTGLTSRAHVAQIIIAGSSSTVYLDNLFFYVGALPPLAIPSVAAPTPTVPTGNVISLFSNAYTNRTVDTWSAVWDGADLLDTTIAGNATKRYTNLSFAGIEFTSSTIDATAMTHFHVDIWTPDPSALPAAFKVQLVDFGANGVYDGGGDDSKDTRTFDATTTPPLVTGNWVSLDIPLASFAALTGRAHLAQLLFITDASGPTTVYVDNVYFYTSGGGGGGSAPTVAAPTPTVAAGSVISLFSNAYTNVAVDTWSASWDAADLLDTTIAGNATKQYTNLSFAGIEFTSAPIDAAAMTHFHMDIWTPDPTGAPAVFKVKLVDFGADGVFGGTDNVEHELTFSAATTPALATGNWVGLDVPLSAFTNLTTRGHLAQMIISGDPKTVYVDNVYLHN